MSWWNPATWVGSSDGRSQAELDEERARLEAVIAAQNDATYNRILLQRGQSAANDYVAQVAENYAAQDNRPAGEQVTEAAQQGLAEGYGNVTGAIRSTIAAPFRFVWDSVPWWIWVMGLVGLFFYFGGSSVVRRRVSSL